MADIRIKDLANTATSVPADGYEVIDSASGGTEKISRDNKRLDMAAAFVADPATFNLAPLVGGVVAVSRGGTGAATAADARTNLDVPSNAEVAADITDAIGGVGLKLDGPALYFDGSTSDVTVAASPKFAFTDGVDDKPFTVEGWVKASTVANTFLFALYEATSTKRQFACYISATNKLRLELVDAAGNACYNDTDTTLSAYDGQWIHVASVYAGAAAATFGTTAIDNVTHYVNGVAIASTGVPNAAYGGMSDTGAVGYIGRLSSTRGEQHVSAVRVHNRALTATEVERLAKGNDLGFADEWGDHTNQLVVDGDMEAVGTADWIASGGATVSKETASPYSGTRNLKLLSAGAGAHYVETSTPTIASGKRYRAKFRYRTGGTAAVYTFRTNGSAWQEVSTLAGAASWTLHEVEFVAESGRNGRLTFYIVGGDATSYIEVDSFEVVAIGTLADFRAENYDESTGKLYDESDNAYVGVGTSVALTGRAYPVYATDVWTPGLEFATGSTGITYGANTFGRYTRIGDMVYYSGYLTLTSKGSSTGLVYINGLPFTVATSTENHQSGITVGIVSNMAGLTGPVSGLHLDGDTRILLYDWAATGTASLDDTNITNTTEIRFSGTYKIQ